MLVFNPFFTEETMLHYRLLNTILFGSLAIFTCGTPMTPAAELPNILWITSEDHSPTMGCYGDPIARTPNVDALAKKGMIYERCWSVAPVCAPARTCLISGIYPSSSGGIHMRSMVPMPKDAKMYPQFLREAGYYCTNNSKEDYNLEKPNGVWDDSSNKAHWRKRKAGQPFFAIFNSTKSHESQIRTRPHTLKTDPSRIAIPHYHPDHPAVRQDWAQYYDKVSEADSDAGDIMKELAADNLLEDTIVFYYADHGSGMPRSKRWPSNSGLHVPLVVHFPEKWKHLAPKDYTVGGRSSRLVHFVDFAPTLLSIAGIKPPASMQGIAFAGSFQGDAPKVIFGQRGRMDERMDFVRSATDGRFVYIRNFHPHVSQGQHVDYQFQTPTTRVWRELYDAGKTTGDQSLFWEVPKAVEELYELSHDASEVKNLAAIEDYQADLVRLREAVHEHMLRVNDQGLFPEGEMHRRSKGQSPYDAARSENALPTEEVLLAAEFASDYRKTDPTSLVTFLSHRDPAVRYWGAMGFRIRGAFSIHAGQSLLKKALEDESPDVRIAAAETLAVYGNSDEIETSLNVLADLADSSKNDVFTCMAALNAIEAIGKDAAPVYERIKSFDRKAKAQSPDGRYDSYIPRQLQNLDELFGG